MRNHMLGVALLCLPAQLLSSVPASAQAEAYYYQELAMMPVGVGIADALPGGAEAILLRKTEGPIHDVIFLRADVASGETLAAALEALREEQFQGGTCPASRQMIHVAGISESDDVPPIWSGQDLGRAQALVARLRGLEPRDFGSIQGARVRKVWIRRYFGPRDVPPTEPLRTSVC